MATRPVDNLTDGQYDILYCHSGDLTPSPMDACDVRNYGPRTLIAKKKCVRPDINIDRHIYRHISLSGPHCGPEDPSVEKMHRDAVPAH